MLRRFVVLLLSMAVVAEADIAKIPRPLANVVIQTPDRKNINLKSYRGKVVMVVLFLTDCDDCLAMIQEAGKLQNELGPRGFQVVGAAVNNNAPYLVGPFVQRYRPNFPVGFMGAPDPLMKFLGLSPETHPIAPMVMLVDHAGNVRFQYYGKDKQMESPDNLRLLISTLIRQRDEHKAPQQITAPAK